MKYYGKEKCKILKQIRAEIAKNNDIEWVVDECQHKGNCLGTCPKCEAEVRELERKLEERKTLGKAVAVAGIAAGIALSVSGCMTAPNAAAGGNSVPGTSIETTHAPETETETEMVTETETETTAETTAEAETTAKETFEEVLEGEPVPYELEGDVEYVGDPFEDEGGELLGKIVAPVEPEEKPEQ